MSVAAPFARPRGALFTDAFRVFGGRCVIEGGVDGHCAMRPAQFTTRAAPGREWPRARPDRAAAVGFGVKPTMIALVLYGLLRLARLQHVASDGVAVTTLLCMSTPVQVGLLFWFARLRSSSAIEYLALTLPRRRDIIILLLSAAALLAISDGVSWLLGKNVVTSFQDDIYRSAASAGLLVWLWLAVVIVAPIGEETLFRGFLFRGWQRSPDDAWTAIGSTAFQWAVAHVQYNPLVVGEILLVGLALGWVRWRTGSTISTILLHSFLNAASTARVTV